MLMSGVQEIFPGRIDPCRQSNRFQKTLHRCAYQVIVIDNCHKFALLLIAHAEKDAPCTRAAQSYIGITSVRAQPSSRFALDRGKREVKLAPRGVFSSAHRRPPCDFNDGAADPKSHAGAMGFGRNRKHRIYGWPGLGAALRRYR